MRRIRTAQLRAIYWTLTLLFALPQCWSAFQYLSESPRMSITVQGLGYPEYFLTILGVAKLLGLLAILTGASVTLKEWAYAGFTFDALGAMASHLSVGDSLAIVAVPLAFLVIQLASYAIWRRLLTQSHGRRRYLLGERTRELAEGHA